MMSLLLMSLGDRNRKDGTGVGGWVHLNGADIMAGSGLCFRKSPVGFGWAFLSSLENSPLIL